MNVIFVGGPDSKKFLNNYFNGLAGHGVNVVRHWSDPKRKTYVPADVQAVIVNGDASSSGQRTHVKAMCEREGVPMIIGNNSVSHTVSLMIDRGLISVVTVEAPQIQTPAEPETPADEVPEEKVVTKLEEAKELVISRDGGLRLRMSMLSENLEHPVTRSLTPVMWGDEFYASKTALAEKHDVGPANLGTYVNSGNPFKGRVLRMAAAEDVLRVYPGIKVTDEREKIARTIEIEDGRAFTRLDGGRRQKLYMCPDKQIRTRQEAADYAGLSERSLDGKAEAGIDWFREPSLDEIRAAWPAAEIRNDEVVEKKAKTENVSGDVRLMDLIKAPAGTNFVALMLNDNTLLVPVSDAARALMPETRVFRDLDAVVQLFPVGLLRVRL